jgi:Fur family peroxide stress response transcriptional regulator
MINPKKDIASLFRGRGLPLTQQRRAVIEALQKSSEHPSAEEMYRNLKRRYPSLSLATVYKTLHTLRELGLASLVNAPHAEARYDAITGTHHHAICVDCGRIQDLFDRRLDRLRAPRGAKGFKTINHSVHFLGRCAGCSRRRPRALSLRRSKQ